MVMGFSYSSTVTLGLSGLYSASQGNRYSTMRQTTATTRTIAMMIRTHKGPGKWAKIQPYIYFPPSLTWSAISVGGPSAWGRHPS